MENEINTAYLLVSVICYLIVEILKTTPVKSQLYPLASLVVGGILGGVGNYFFPEVICAAGMAQAVIFGALCGLAATGGDQVCKQVTKLLKRKDTSG